MASSGIVDVLLATLGGRCLQISMSTDATVADLKLRAFVAWDLPPLCQELLAGADMLENTAKLAEYHTEAGEPLQLTLLVRLDLVMTQLHSLDAAERKEAVQAMGFNANQDDDSFRAIEEAYRGNRSVLNDALDAFVKLAKGGEGPRFEQIVHVICKHSIVDTKAAEHASVRIPPKGHLQMCGLLKLISKDESIPGDAAASTAIAALCRIATPSDDSAICWVIDILNNETSNLKVCLAAARGIANLAPRGHGTAVNALCKLLGRVDAEAVRLAALTSFEKCAEPGDLQVVESVVLCAKPGKSQLMKKVVQVLGQLACFGHKEAIAVAADYLSHKNRDVRRSAAQTLGKISQKNDEKIISGMIKYFVTYVDGWQAKHGEGVEIGVMLQHLVDKGHERVMTTISPYLDSYKDWVKQAAIEVLGFVAPSNDESAISTCIEATKLSVAPTAQAAVIALMRITGLKHEPANNAACECLNHHDSWVRRSAAEAFSEVIGKGNSQVVSALCTCCQEDRDAEVCQKAACALGNVAENGDCEATAALVSMLQHRDEWSRRAGAEALAKVAALGNEVAVAALLPRLRDGDDEVVLLSIRALAKVAGKGNAHAVQALLPCLAHDRKELREAALETFEHISTRGDPHVTAVLKGQLADGKGVTKIIVLKALGMVLTQDDHDSLSSLYKELAHPKPVLREAALQCLQRITGVLESPGHI